MKVTINKPTTLLILDLLRTSVPTLNGRIRTFMHGTASEEDILACLIRAREIRNNIRHDADATLRLMGYQPERSEDYLKVWALQTEKAATEIALMIADAIDAAIVDVETTVPVTSTECVRWSTPEVKQVEDVLAAEADALDPETEEPVTTEDSPEEEDPTE